MDVFVSPMMRHVLLSYSTILKWLLPICIVITVIVFILFMFVLYMEVLFFTGFPPCCTALSWLLPFNLGVIDLVYRVLLPLLLVFTTFWHSCLLVGRVASEPPCRWALAYPRHSQVIHIVAVGMLFLLSCVHFPLQLLVFAWCGCCAPFVVALLG